jgi:hypothetical protein
MGSVGVFESEHAARNAAEKNAPVTRMEILMGIPPLALAGVVTEAARESPRGQKFGGRSPERLMCREPSNT